MSDENSSASCSGHANKNKMIKKIRPSNFKCLENTCSRSFKTNNKLICHLSEDHGMKFEYLEFSFKSYEEFLQWKAKIEEENCVNYVCKSKSGNTSYYYCNRSFDGKNGRDKGIVYKRLLKSQGSCKMDSSCTSQLNILKEKGKLCVFWQKTHYGHGRDLKHVRLTNNQKLSVASKLISGVKPTKILDSARDNIGEHLNRLHLITSKDISNIKTKYNVEVKEEKNLESDDVSVDLWVQKCQVSTLISAIDNIKNMDLSKLDSSVIEQICYHLSIVADLANMPSLDCKTLASTSKQSDSDNKRVIDTRLQFQSTKTPTKNRKTILSSPTEKELINIDSFLSTDLYVSTCPSNDHRYSKTPLNYHLRGRGYGRNGKKVEL